MPRVYAAEGYDALTFLAQALGAGVKLDTTPFSTNGVTGELESAPLKTEIAKLRAMAMRVDSSGKLAPFVGTPK